MKYLFLVAALLLAAGQAHAQTGQAVTQAPSEQRSSTLVAATAPAVNATQAAGTVTIAPQSGYYVYINYLQVGVCIDNAAVAVNTPQLAFTSTNLGGWTQQLSILQGATTGTTGIFISCQYMGGARGRPLRSAAPGVAVTIVPPAQQAHSSYPVNVEYYYAQ